MRMVRGGRWHTAGVAALALWLAACSHSSEGGGKGRGGVGAQLPPQSGPHAAVSATLAAPPATGAAAASASAGSATTGTGAAAAPATDSAAPRAAGPAPAPSWFGGPTYNARQPVDVVIAGGEVIDGTGAQAVKADVVIDKGRILHLGTVAPEVPAKRRIDATGLVVTPGFIDMHAHAAPVGDNNNLLAMGVTSAVIGQDGRSPAQGRISGWLNRVQHSRLSVNLAALVGHATIRGLANVGGTNPSDRQIAKMARMLGEDLDAGAFGLSTGLEYQPGAQASRKELIGIAKPVAARDGIIMSHLRSEDDDLIEQSIDELLAQGRQGARVHVAHIKVVYGKGEARAEALLAKMAAARSGGIKLTADLYPYNASYTTISIVFPAFAKPPASFAQARQSRRAELAAFLRNKVTRRGGPEATLFGSAPYAGKTLAQLAKERRKPFEDVLIDDIGPGGASAAYFVMDEALQSRLLADPWVMVGTDGGSYSSHPRGHGTFARIIAEYVRKNKTLTLVEAVRKMSGLAAHSMRFDRLDRGILRPGNWADVLIFDPSQVQDHASYARPHQRSTGMRWVFVNGQAAMANGKLTGVQSGKLLRPARSESK